MKILIVAPRFPLPPSDGGRVRTYNIVKRLGARHQVHLLCFVDRYPEPEHLRSAEAVCDRVEVIRRRAGRFGRLATVGRGLPTRTPMSAALFGTRHFRHAVQSALAAGPFDIVQVEGSYTASAIAGTALMRDTTVVLSTQNVEAERLERMAQVGPGISREVLLGMESRRMASWEPRMARSFDGIMAVSERDADTFRRWCPGVPVHLAPNGVDLEYFAPRDGERSENGLLFVGSMDYPPNIDAATWFAERVLPRIHAREPQAQLRIVGRHANRLRHLRDNLPGVEITGYLDDVRTAYWDCSVFVVPLRAGGGTRLKILEAMASGLPVVSTAIGAEGLNVTHGADILISDDEAAFANAAIDLLRDRGRAHRLAHEARKLVVREYSWDTIVQGMEAFYATTCQ